jgi:peptidoglycan/LPS O-acetylase OafA/YrhL
MPEPTEPGRHYVAGLDGIRALAVLAVILYHLGFSWAAGGMLGVGVFFTLSGYLITDLLLNRWRRHADIGLRTFWVRRARRLLPALFTMLAVVSVLVAIFDSSALGGLRRQALSAALYFANWSTIAQHGSYFARFAAPLPLDHLWSLSIEEQFYLVWPLVLVLGIWLARGRRRLALATLALAAGSLLVVASLYHPGYDPTRIYEGTDTRAFGLLIGAALAMVWPSRVPKGASRRGTRRGVDKALDAAGALGLVGIAVLVWRTSPLSGFLYPDGFLLLTLATVAVIAAAVNPGSRLGDLLGWRPLRWLGVRSYGIYLWQWPIIVLLSPGPGAQPLGRAVIEVGITVVVAGLSWRFLEDPIRRGALVRLRQRLTSGPEAVLARRRALAVSGTTAALLLPVLGLAGLLPAAYKRVGSAQSAALLRHVPGPLLVSAHRSKDPLWFVVQGTPTTADPSPTSRPEPAPISTREPFSTSKRTSCRSVVYIGDSTSEGLISTDYIPNPRLRLQSQLADVGVRTVYPEISGARSIVEVYKNFPNAATVAREHVAEGYHGCWILAMGTNDVADIHTGSTIGLATRIAQMMRIIGQQPTLWVDVVTLVRSGNPYAETGMQSWNRDLLAACSRYPNMRVFDWAGYVQRKWFIPDGIHYYSPGYVARAHLISQGLAHAFPARGGPSASCVVR